MSSFMKSAELTSDGLYLLLGWCWLLYDVRLVMGNAAREEEGCTHLGADVVGGRWHWVLRSMFPSWFLLKNMKYP